MLTVALEAMLVDRQDNSKVTSSDFRVYIGKTWAQGVSRDDSSVRGKFDAIVFHIALPLGHRTAPRPHDSRPKSGKQGAYRYIAGVARHEDGTHDATKRISVLNILI